MSQATKTKDGFTAMSYEGDGSVLLAFNLAKDKIKNFAGFSIQCTSPSKGSFKTNKYWLTNRLNFEKGLTKDVKVDTSKFVGSDQAPFQMFRWVHFPNAGPGKYTYSVFASYFKNGSVEQGPGIDLPIDLTHKSFPSLEMGFTRGYLSSQAYTHLFKNKPIAPKKKSIDFDTKSYQPQYEWLGAHARKLVFEFVEECLKDKSISVDVFAFDFDEPDVIQSLIKIGPRLRLYQDDASLHVGAAKIEPKAAAALKKAGASVQKGHFRRFAHDKVMIQKKNGKAIKVLTGSANFSIRGLYVQANSVLVFDDPFVADLYEQAFESAFTNPKKFDSSPIASKWFSLKNKEKTVASFCFSPHKKPTFSLGIVSEAIKKAKSSVLFAVMAATGGGQVIEDLKNMGEEKNVLALGTIQQKGQLKAFHQNEENSSVASFGFLKDNVPKQFQPEWSGGAGQVIHHKFIVCDFNDSNPSVFCGSSNLAEGGEQSNGDNLIAIYDPGAVSCYAIEAIRLFDHYNFRTRHAKSTSKNPLKLDQTEDWVAPYYDPKNIRSLERQVLCPV